MSGMYRGGHQQRSRRQLYGDPTTEAALRRAAEETAQPANSRSVSLSGASARPLRPGRPQKMQPAKAVPAEVPRTLADSRAADIKNALGYVAASRPLSLRTSYRIVSPEDEAFVPDVTQRFNETAVQQSPDQIYRLGHMSVAAMKVIEDTPIG